MREGFVPLPFLYSVTAALDGWWRPGAVRCRRNSHWTAGGAGWRPVPTEPPPDTETPRQPPGHFGRRPNWANVAGEPPARFRGTLRPTPALGPAPGGDRCRRSPRQTRNPPPDTEPPPASRALWETAQLGKRRREPPARFRGTLRPTPALGPAPTAVGAGW